MTLHYIHHPTYDERAAAPVTYDERAAAPVTYDERAAAPAILPESGVDTRKATALDAMASHLTRERCRHEEGHSTRRHGQPSYLRVV